MHDNLAMGILKDLIASIAEKRDFPSGESIVYLVL